MKATQQNTEHARAACQNDLLDTKQVAAELNVTVGCVVRWRRLNKPPAFVKLNGIIRYHRTDVDAALAQRKGEHA